MTHALHHGLLWGLILSLYLGPLFVLLSRINPEMWLDDYPPDIRAAYGPMRPATNRQRWLLGVPVLAGALAIVIYATVRFVTHEVPAPGAAAVFVHTFVVLTTFNLVDLVLIDWLFFVRIRPRWVVLPGTDGLAGYDNDVFHGHAFLKGTVGIIVLSALVTLVVGLAV